MNPVSLTAFFLGLATGPLTAGTVLVTSLPDATRPLAPLASLDGLALETGTEVRIGAFPGMSDAAILDAARAGGLARISSDFVTFGAPRNIGDGVDGRAGNFEISVRGALAAASLLFGQEISILITKAGGQEFLVMRFKGRNFEADPETGIESLVSLHLADAKLITGDRYGRNQLSTAPAPVIGSYESWIANFPELTDAADLLPDADPDGDGRVNFLEYATGGDPAIVGNEAFCQLVSDGTDGLQIRFSRANGIGVIPVIEWSPDLITPWVPLEGSASPDNNASVRDGIQWLNLPIPATSAPRGFFRLKTVSGS